MTHFAIGDWNTYREDNRSWRFHAVSSQWFEAEWCHHWNCDHASIEFLVFGLVSDALPMYCAFPDDKSLACMLLQNNDHCHVAVAASRRWSSRRKTKAPVSSYLRQSRLITDATPSFTSCGLSCSQSSQATQEVPRVRTLFPKCWTVRANEERWIRYSKEKWTILQLQQNFVNLSQQF